MIVLVLGKTKKLKVSFRDRANQIACVLGPAKWERLGDIVEIVSTAPDGETVVIRGIKIGTGGIIASAEADRAGGNSALVSTSVTIKVVSKASVAVAGEISGVA